MNSPGPRGAPTLSDELSRDVLERASEIDAALRVGVSVADLRAAAIDAGISEEAFNAALAQARNGELGTTRVSNRTERSNWRRWVAVAAAATMIIAGAMLMKSPVSPPAARDAILLRCLTPGQAAELARPHVGRSGRITVNPTTAPGVLTVEGTTEDVQRVRTVIEQNDGTGGSCAR